MNLRIILLFSLFLLSCSPKNKEVQTVVSGDKLNFKLPDGDVLTIITNEKGYDLLLISRAFDWSLHKKEDQIKTMANFKDEDSKTIVDVDGDFIPNYIIQNGKKTELSFIKK